MPDSTRPRVIGCGMYAFTDELRISWRQLFGLLDTADAAITEGIPPADNLHIEFAASDQLYLSGQTLLAHTCGYPYMQRWRGSHIPVCVPVFDIDGCEGAHYRSWFITQRYSRKNQLGDFHNTVVAVNAMESNSGMNVLRHAVSKLKPDSPFFKQVRITGSHYGSMQSVASGSADIAAVDAVSFYFGCQQDPSLASRLRIFEQSMQTVGLPFICHRREAGSAGRIIDQLNSAAARMENNFLNLDGFNAVSEQDYLPIIEAEHSAVAAGYPVLR